LLGVHRLQKRNSRDAIDIRFRRGVGAIAVGCCIDIPPRGLERSFEMGENNASTLHLHIIEDRERERSLIDVAPQAHPMPITTHQTITEMLWSN